MLSKKITKVLNDQIAIEAHASFYYLSLASWCQNNGLEGAAKFFYQQSEEERLHMLRLFHYINESGGIAVSPSIAVDNTSFKAIKDVFQTFLDMEIKVSEAVNQLVAICTSEKDYTTLQFIQWYVSEQHEEEVLARNILDKIKIVGNDGAGLYMLDKELATLSVQTTMKATGNNMN